jgi:hypothetical protein
MGPKVLGRYCKMGGNRNFKKLVGTLKGEWKWKTKYMVGIVKEGGKWKKKMCKVLQKEEKN